MKYYHNKYGSKLRIHNLDLSFAIIFTQHINMAVHLVSMAQLL